MLLCVVHWPAAGEVGGGEGGDVVGGGGGGEVGDRVRGGVGGGVGGAVGVVGSMAVAQVTLFPAQAADCFLLHFPGLPLMHASAVQPLPLSPTWYTWPFGHLHEPPQPPMPGTFLSNLFL